MSACLLSVCLSVCQRRNRCVFLKDCTRPGPWAQIGGRGGEGRIGARIGSGWADIFMDGRGLCAQFYIPRTRAVHVSRAGCAYVMDGADTGRLYLMVTRTVCSTRMQTETVPSVLGMWAARVFVHPLFCGRCGGRCGGCYSGHWWCWPASPQLRTLSNSARGRSMCDK